MSQSDFRPIPATLLFLLLIPEILCYGGHLLAQENTNLEVGGDPSSADDDSELFEEMDILDSQLDLSVQYARFTGEDMRDSYGGLPMIVAGFSFQTARTSRLFLSVGYGENTGDPYYDTPGISAADQIRVRYAPVQLGMKVDLARSTRIHVFAGAAFEIAWMEETVPLLDDFGRVMPISSSGFNSGYHLVFGPQFVLGRGRHAVGLEVGWGGSKGTVSTKGHHHDIDMTGYRGRLYLALGL
jgi:hypothetical protein